MPHPLSPFFSKMQTATHDYYPHSYQPPIKMRLLFPYATIASISGATLIVAFTSTDPQQVNSELGSSHKPSFFAESHHITSKVQEDECYFSAASKIQGAMADTGILSSCGAGWGCIEDVTSSLGGRCVLIGDALGRIVQTHQRTLDGGNPCYYSNCTGGIPCNYDNGTAGIKCYGLGACDDVSPDIVGCGSCIGKFACYHSGCESLGKIS